MRSGRRRDLLRALGLPTRCRAAVPRPRAAGRPYAGAGGAGTRHRRGRGRPPPYRRLGQVRGNGMTVAGLQPELFFSDAEYERRHRAVRARMQAQGIDVLLVTTPENVFYLTGYQTFAYSTFQILVLPLEAEPFLAIRHLESMLADRYSFVRQIVRW